MSFLFLRISIFIDQLRANNIPVIELASPTRNPSRIINRLLKEWKIDPPKIVHTHLYHAGMIGRVCAKFAGIEQVIVHQHGPEQNRSPPAPYLIGSPINL